MSATISDKVMMKEVLKATGFDCPQGMENKTFEQATSGGGSGGGGEDKLLCYYIKGSSPNCSVVYTDKPATQITYGITGTFEESYLPVDDGKHLFIAGPGLDSPEYDHINLIYEDGSPATDLKGKFVEVSH